MTDDLARPSPADIQTVRGHEHAIEPFQRALDQGKAAGAWLLAGPQGIGKATAAHALARHVLITQPGATEDGPGLFGEEPPAQETSSPLSPNLNHPIGQRIHAGGHGGLKIIERGFSDAKMTKRRTQIRVDEVRGLGPFFSMTPSEGRWRVVLIDAADELNTSAANAVLKGLEEPPAHTVILLVAHNPARLLPTIRSRCRTLSFAPLAQETVVDLLMDYEPSLSSSDATSLAEIADGSIGRAFSLFDAGGLDFLKDINGLLGHLPKLDRVKAHAVSDKLSRSDQSFETGRWVITWWLGRMIREKAMSTSSHGLDQWLALWENTARLMDRASAVHLDKKRVFMDTFASMQRCAQV